MMGEVEESAIVAMQPRPVLITIRHHRPHVVVQDLARNPAEEVERVLMAAEQRLQPLIAHELDVRRPAPTQRCDEHRQPITSPPDRRKVSLHLSPRVGLKAYHRLRRRAFYSFSEIVAVWVELARPQHEALRCGVPHAGVGHFSIGHPGSLLHRHQQPRGR